MHAKSAIMLGDPKKFIRDYHCSLRINKGDIIDCVANKLMKFIFEQLEICATRPKRAFLLSKFLSKELILLRQLQPSLFLKDYTKYFKDKQMINFIAAYIDLELKASEFKADIEINNRITMHIDETLKICPDMKEIDILFHMTRVKYKYLDYLRNIFVKYFHRMVFTDLDIINFLRHIIVCKKWYDEEYKKDKELGTITDWRERVFEYCSSIKVPLSFLVNEEIPSNVRTANNVIDYLLRKSSLAITEEMYKKCINSSKSVVSQEILALNVVDLTLEDTTSDKTSIVDLTVESEADYSYVGRININRDIKQEGSDIIISESEKYQTNTASEEIPELVCIANILNNITKYPDRMEFIDLDSENSDSENINVEIMDASVIVSSAQAKIILETHDNRNKVENTTALTRNNANSPIESSSLLSPSQKPITSDIEDLLDEWGDDDNSNQPAKKYISHIITPARNSITSVITPEKHLRLAPHSMLNQRRFDEKTNHRIIFSTPIERTRRRRNSFDSTQNNERIRSVMVASAQISTQQRNKASCILIRRDYTNKSSNNSLINRTVEDRRRVFNENFPSNVNTLPQRRHSMHVPANITTPEPQKKQRGRPGKPKKNVTFQDKIRINCGNITTPNVDPEKNTFLRKLAVQLNSIKSFIDTKDKWVSLKDCRKFELAVKRQRKTNRFLLKNAPVIDPKPASLVGTPRKRKSVADPASTLIVTPRKRGRPKMMTIDDFNSPVYLAVDSKDNQKIVQRKLQDFKRKCIQPTDVITEKEITCHVQSDYELRSPISNPQITSTVKTKKTNKKYSSQGNDKKPKVKLEKIKRMVVVKNKTKNFTLKGENAVTSTSNTVKKKRKKGEKSPEPTSVIIKKQTDSLKVDNFKKPPSNSDELDINKAEKIIVSIKRTKNVQKIIESAAVEPRCETTDSGIDSVLNTPERTDESSTHSGSLSQMDNEIVFRTGTVLSNEDDSKQEGLESCKSTKKMSKLPDLLNVSINNNNIRGKKRNSKFPPDDNRYGKKQFSESEDSSFMDDKSTVKNKGSDYFPPEIPSSSQKPSNIFQEKIEEYKIRQNNFLNVKSDTPLNDFLSKETNLPTFFKRQNEIVSTEDDCLVSRNDAPSSTKVSKKCSTSMPIGDDPIESDEPLSGNIEVQLSKLTVNDSSSNYHDQIIGRRKRRQLAVIAAEGDKEKPKRHRRKRKSLYHHVPEEVLCSNASISPSLITDEYDDPLELPSTSASANSNIAEKTNKEPKKCLQKKTIENYPEEKLKRGRKKKDIEVKRDFRKKTLCQEMEALKNDQTFGKLVVGFQQSEDHADFDEENFVVVRETRRKFNVVPSNNTVLKSETKKKKKTKKHNDNEIDENDEEIINATSDDIVSPEYEPISVECNSRESFKSPDGLDDITEEEDEENEGDLTCNTEQCTTQREICDQNLQEMILTMVEENDQKMITLMANEVGANNANKSIGEEFPVALNTVPTNTVAHNHYGNHHNNHHQRHDSMSVSHATMSPNLHQYDEVYTGNSSPGFNNGGGIMVSSDSEMDDMNELFDYSDISDDDRQSRAFVKLKNVEVNNHHLKSDNNGYFREFQSRIEGIECESIEFSTNEKYKDKLLSATTNAFTSTLNDYISHPIKNFNCVFAQNDLQKEDENIAKQEKDDNKKHENIVNHKENEQNPEVAEKTNSNNDISSHFSGITIDTSLVIATNDFVSDNHINS